jgi:hypothetical protein
MTANILHIKGREAPKAKRSAMETLIFSRDDVLTWKIPPFQRPIRVNDKVMSVSEAMKADGGMVPGVLTLGRLGTDKTIYVVDGQHRLEAFKIAGLSECLADARMCTYSSMAEMADDFVELNGKLVTMRPDDILRGLEESLPQLRRVRASCDFVTYGQIRRGDAHSALIGMSQLLRCWHMGHADVPARHSPAATVLAQSLEADEADKLILCMQICRAAWGTDQENYRLWGSLNLTLTMWIWRRLVLDTARGVKKAVVLTQDDFRKCLMSVSANSDYLEWLVGRQMGERDRTPCYGRLRAIFVKRLESEKGAKVMFPQPAWAVR